ncbi:phage baseplate assembly protein domain-containing protein [Muricoccus aerilatus]|uniref:phage baseplate assembly protein domain-containing protein n=1 Tax=Muricoccus aerilatus TaxID=452982 RepID=UPI0005C19AF6|nr:phage baseplate assembly protein [Roseomonas aerilata]
MNPRQIAGRIGMMVGLGRIMATRTDRATGRSTLTAQVRLPETGEVRDDTPVLSLYGVSSRPRPGADAAVLFLGGNRGAGVVIATSDGRFSIELAEGEVALHTHDGSHVHVKLGGKIAVKASVEVTMDTPLLRVTGDVVVGGVSLVHHVHKQVRSGPDLSGEPNA